MENQSLTTPRVTADRGESGCVTPIRDTRPTTFPRLQKRRQAKSLVVLCLLLSACVTKSPHYLPDIEDRRFPSIEDALFHAFEYAHSTNRLRELGGHIYRHPSGGYMVWFQKNVLGTELLGTQTDLVLRIPTDSVAWFHTHVYDQHHRDFWQCSPEDQQISVEVGVPGYVQAYGYPMQDCLEDEVVAYKEGFMALRKLR